MRIIIIKKYFLQLWNYDAVLSCNFRNAIKCLIGGIKLLFTASIIRVSHADGLPFLKQEGD